MSLLQVHLVICSSFLSLANKAEFLDLGYVSAPSSWVPPSPAGTQCAHLRPPLQGWAACSLEAGYLLHIVIYKLLGGQRSPFKRTAGNSLVVSSG